MKKILIIGTGSIGIRHIRCLLKVSGYTIAAYRTKRGNIKELPEDIQNKIIYFYNEDEAFAWDPDVLIISNPTSLHLKYVLKAIEYNIDTLVEKPLAEDLTEIDKFKEILKNHDNYIAVGYNLRFNPLIDQIKTIISSNIYGTVIKAELNVGHYLPYWHPYEDYQTSYVAKKDLGGGVIRTLSHEIDLGQYLFGKYKKIFSQVLKISDLKIDVDDYSFIFAEMESGVVLNISMDYLNPVSRRTGSILFEEGLLEYDFQDMTINFLEYSLNSKRQTIGNYSGYDYNYQYENQLIHFLNQDKSKICTLDEGINLLNVIKKCEESSDTGSMINV